MVIFRSGEECCSDEEEPPDDFISNTFKLEELIETCVPEITILEQDIEEVQTNSYYHAHTNSVIKDLKPVELVKSYVSVDDFTQKNIKNFIEEEMFRLSGLSFADFD